MMGMGRVAIADAGSFPRLVIYCTGIGVRSDPDRCRCRFCASFRQRTSVFEHGDLADARQGEEGMGEAQTAVVAIPDSVFQVLSKARFYL